MRALLLGAFHCIFTWVTILYYHPQQALLLSKPFNNLTIKWVH